MHNEVVRMQAQVLGLHQLLAREQEKHVSRADRRVFSDVLAGVNLRKPPVQLLGIGHDPAPWIIGKNLDGKRRQKEGSITRRKQPRIDALSHFPVLWGVYVLHSVRG